MKKLVTIFIISLVVSCNSRPDPEPAFKVRHEKETVPIISLSDLKLENEPIDYIENINFIQPQSTENSLIGSYDKIVTQGDTLYIMESSSSQNAIFAFSLNGDFLFKIDKMGRDPGEYLGIRDFFIDPKNKYIGILDRQRILKYDFQGEFIEAINLKDTFPINVDCKDGIINVYAYANCSYNQCYVFKSFDATGQLLYEDYPQNKEENYFILQKASYLTGDSQYTYINLLHNDTIYQVGKEYLKPKFVVDFGKYKMPKEELDELVRKGSDANFFDLTKLDYVAMGLNNFAFTDQNLYLFIVKQGIVYHALYSFNSRNVKIITSFGKQSMYLGAGPLKPFNSRSLYSVIPINEALLVKQNEEALGILDAVNTRQKFDSGRMDFYNKILKNVQPNGNPIIAVVEMKDF